jgi:hypothetical protein
MIVESPGAPGHGSNISRHSSRDPMRPLRSVDELARQVRSGDRMNGGMSAIGTKRTIRPHPSLSAIGVIADIGRLWSGMSRSRMTQSGHRLNQLPLLTRSNLLYF